MNKKSIKKFDKNVCLDYTYIVYETFFVFISSAL